MRKGEGLQGLAGAAGWLAFWQKMSGIVLKLSKLPAPPVFGVSRSKTPRTRIAVSLRPFPTARLCLSSPTLATFFFCGVCVFYPPLSFDGKLHVFVSTCFFLGRNRLLDVSVSLLTDSDETTHPESLDSSTFQEGNETPLCPLLLPVVKYSKC